ncbi:2'-5' RNA ligase family protein [Actinomadura violacea]|uniref:2'-5' RNA ligase family protein n=1 Tax=Actinomadura violacea TaxID=2819934 RepID=A0ABS3RV05_9ACTN|nr:2'-5' RNA ligase family protein [Actinomadura violacea]MBO2459849.1 2'-5' RNA ligase family protein [Actinomadura violacea]
MRAVPLDDPRAFPPAPPADLDDAEAIAANDWEAFRQVAQMRDHWSRPGWYPGRRAYYWMLTFPDEPELLAMAHRCQSAIAPLGLDLIPDDGLHITLTRIAEAGTPRARLDALAEHAAEQIPTAFELSFGPLAGSPGAVRFSVVPWRPLVELHAVLAHANLRAGVDVGTPTARFRPHLGIAYSNRVRPAAPIIETVAILREAEPVLTQVVSVELVELRREASTYKWDVLHRVPLRQAATPDR